MSIDSGVINNGSVRQDEYSYKTIVGIEMATIICWLDNYTWVFSWEKCLTYVVQFKCF